MDLKLVFQLSLFGLAMAFATVFWIPAMVEPLVWLVIFLFCAYVIAKSATGRAFAHGVLLGLANSVWITAAHVLWFDRYIAKHPQEAAMITTMNHPRVAMALTGPAVGIISGAVIGLFAWIATRMLRRNTAAA